MTVAQVLSFVIAQTWQVAALASIVWLVVRYATREHSHLSHMLWTLVLIKCLTPPIWSSPIGLFSRWSPTTVLNQLSNAPRASKEQSSRKLTTSAISMDSEGVLSGTSIATQVSTPAEAGASRDLRPAVVSCWLGGAAVFAVVGLIRFCIFLRQIRRTTIATPPEVARCVERLSKQLQLRQKVSVRVVTSSVGPAVYGLFRPVIVLPQAIVMGKTESQLEPLIAHEMIHVRRGDLLIALVQSLACNLGWFHPMVWFASRCVTIESERCCDEETIASLQCKPAVYARSLLDVLERKNLLRVAPALPGVRPVDITSARLERIMRLGQGSRRRSPWWVLCLALVGAIAVLPGARYVAAQQAETLDKQGKTATALSESENHGARILKAMRLKSPTGRSADDITMELANNAFYRSQWKEALEAYCDLISTYPDSPHQFSAHMQAARAAIASYQGKEGSSEPLDKATKLIEQLKSQFPEKAAANDRRIRTLVSRVERSAGFRKNRVNSTPLIEETPGTAAIPIQTDSKHDGEKSTLLMEVEIFEVGANSPAEMELALWLEKQTTGTKSEGFKQLTPAKAIRGVPILSKILYFDRLLRVGGNTQSDGPVVQASAQVAAQPRQFVTPASEDVDSFTASMKKLETVKSLSAPKLICQSEQTAMISVEADNSPKPSAGFSLSLKPIELRDGNLILDYSKSATKESKHDSATTAIWQNNKANLPAAYQTSSTFFAISMAFGQSLVVVSKGAEEDSPQEVVVVKLTKTERPK